MKTVVGGASVSFFSWRNGNVSDNSAAVFTSDNAFFLLNVSLSLRGYYVEAAATGFTLNNDYSPFVAYTASNSFVSIDK